VIAMISADRMKSVRTAPLILSRSTATRSTCGIGQRGRQRFVFGRFLVRAVHELVRELLKAFEAEKGAAHHQQRRHRPGREPR
jgi:hypothetical protein